MVGGCWEKFSVFSFQISGFKGDGEMGCSVLRPSFSSVKNLFNLPNIRVDSRD